MGKPFWGRIAVSEVVGAGGMLLGRDALTFPKQAVPLMLAREDRERSPEDVVGRVDKFWYGDESGLQVVLFLGAWIQDVPYNDTELSVYLSAFKIESEKVETGFGSIHHKVTGGEVTHAMVKPDAFMPAWDGLFIRSEPLPQMLRESLRFA